MVTYVVLGSTLQRKILTGEILTNLTSFDNLSKFSSSIFLKNGTFKVLIRILLERGILSIFSPSIFQREVIRQDFRILHCMVQLVFKYSIRTVILLHIKNYIIGHTNRYHLGP